MSTSAGKPFYYPQGVTTPSPQLQAVLRWFDALIKHDIHALSDVLTDDYVHPILPQSLGLPTYDRAGFLEFVEKVLIPFMTQYEYTVLDALETPDRVMIHTAANGSTSTGHPYTSELLLVARVVQQADGEYRIQQMKEFVDAGMLVSGFFDAEMKRMESVRKVVSS
ncbi:hypothetical protein EIP91_004674 [Steccherinum ochraceum]|uniref:SnoaL-like domain-containing protein n=1 Tax=Steccherinum ochraceum TaxID=92696 RepID=A0A4R0RAY7_9APHY|nr:hypothetical protein EIP91_004674 [Steccherinum ochraceum]